jgi:hypothetical protein
MAGELGGRKSRNKDMKHKAVGEKKSYFLKYSLHFSQKNIAFAKFSIIEK